MPGPSRLRPLQPTAQPLTLRNRMIEAGWALMRTRGYHLSSTRDVLEKTGGSPGTFTGHFRTKEDFALAILEREFAALREVEEQILDDRKRPPRWRLDAYFKALANRLTDGKTICRCLIGEFGREAPATGCDRLKARVAEVHARWLETVTGVVMEGKQQGGYVAKLPPKEAAAFLLAGWQGACAQAAADNNPDPMNRFRETALALLFARS